jgi:hypothetical protein
MAGSDTWRNRAPHATACPGGTPPAQGVLWAEAHHLIMHYAFTMRGRREDGLALSRPLASAVIATFIIICLLVLPQPTSRRSGADQQLKRDDA